MTMENGSSKLIKFAESSGELNIENIVVRDNEFGEEEDLSVYVPFGLTGFFADGEGNFTVGNLTFTGNNIYGVYSASYFLRYNGENAFVLSGKVLVSDNYFS